MSEMSVAEYPVPRPEEAPPKPVRLNPGAFDEVWERLTTAAAGGTGGNRPPFPRKRLTFVLEARLCEPGTFVEDIEVTLLSPSSAAEIEAIQRAKSDVTLMAYETAKGALHAVNGKVLDRSRGEDEFLWEVLGPGGRQLVVAMWMRIGAADAEALGKAQDSSRMS